ncbi:MAG: hypothetical protein ACRDZQ_03515 [Acidimicrobiales bacterium]
MVMVRAEVVAVAEGLVDEADAWRAAYERWQRAVARREREVARAEHRLVAATGGLGPHRWQQACHRRRILTVADARLRARAIRARPAVEAALVEQDRALAEAEAAVAAARRALAVESKLMQNYGALGASLTGLTTAELARLARRVPNP